MKLSPRITLLAVLLIALVMLLIGLTYVFDKEATHSAFYEVEGFESLETDNAEKIADIYNRLSVMNSNLSVLKARFDDYEPDLKRMRQREEQVKQDTAAAQAKASTALESTIETNLAAATSKVDVPADQVARIEKDDIKTRIGLQEQREKEQAAQEGFKNWRSSSSLLELFSDLVLTPSTKEGKIMKQYIEDSTQNITERERAEALQDIEGDLSLL